MSGPSSQGSYLNAGTQFAVWTVFYRNDVLPPLHHAHDFVYGDHCVLLLSTPFLMVTDVVILSDGWGSDYPKYPDVSKRSPQMDVGFIDCLNGKGLNRVVPALRAVITV